MTPAEIAARLTPAQKRAFLAVTATPAGGSFDERLMVRRAWTLVEPPFGWAVNDKPWRMSPLGAEVRAILAAQEAER